MHLRILAAFVTILGITLIQAQEAADPTVEVAEDSSYGAYLTDNEGRSLYLYLEDSEGTSACYDVCAETWPLLTVEGEPVVGEGVDPELVGTSQRDDGATQVTYNGWPLYRSSRDDNPGDKFGHGLGEQFYLVSPNGEIAQEVGSGDGEVTEADEELFAQLMAEGEQIFAGICSTCHGDEGQGKIGPGLDRNTELSSSRLVINTILMGRTEHGMPAFSDQFSDREAAAAATFIRNAWTNEFGLVTEEEVRELR